MWGSFHLDDYSILGDPLLTRISGAWEVWQPARVRPLTYFTLWLNYQAGGADPFGYHLVNWLLHLVSVWLCARTMTRLLPATGALLATTLFALHPIQTETVAYVFARSTLLCGLCCWLAILMWAQRRTWLTVAACALALLAKEEAVALPVVIALLEWSQTRSAAKWRPIAAMLGLALAVGARGLFITATQAGTGAMASAGVTPLAYLATQSYVLLRYAGEIVAPVALNFDPDLAPWNNAAGWGLWLIWIGAVAWAVRRFQQGGCWLLIALAFLAPTSTVLPINDLSADRRLYLVLAAVGAAIAKAWPGIPARLVLALGAIGLVLAFNRSLTWRTEESLWRDTVAKSPAKVRPRVQLARSVAASEALRILGPGEDALTLAERGRVLMELSRPADALQAFGRVLAMDPGDAAALTNRGVALAALGQTEAARSDFARALARDACFFPALRNMRRMGFAVKVDAGCQFSASQREALEGR